MRYFVILVVILALAGGGGFYYYDQYYKDGSGTETAEAEQVQYEFVELTPMHIPVIDSRGVSQMISLVVALEVPDAEVADRIKYLEPKLKDAFIRDMYGALEQKKVLASNGVLQVSLVKARLSRIANHLVGEKGVTDVLLQVVHQRKV